MKQGKRSALPVVGEWKKYGIIILMVIAFGIFTFRDANEFGQAIGENYHLSVLDYLVSFYRGSFPYIRGNDNQPFNIPAFQSFYMIYFFYFISGWTRQMDQKYEQQRILRYQRRSAWWLRQAKSIGCKIGLYLLVTYVTFGICGLIMGGNIWKLDFVYQLHYNGMDVSKVSGILWVMQLIVMPILIMTAMAYIQYVIALLTNAVIGIIFSIASLVCAVFYKYPVFLFNYLMLRRNREFLLDGLDVWIGILMSVIVIVVFMLVSKRIIEKKDLF